MKSLCVAVLIGAGVVGGQPGRTDRPPRPSPQPWDQRARGDDGPRSHEIHFLTSDDGVTFDEVAEPVMRQASVPDIIELSRDLPKVGGAGTSKGHLCIYTVDARDGMREGLSRLASVDGGKTWNGPERINVVWGEGRSRNRGEVDPSVVQLSDGRLRLYFYSMERLMDPREPIDPRGPGELPPIRPLPGSDGQQPPSRPDRPDPGIPAPQERRGPERGKQAICSAVSEDGLRFVGEDGVRFEDEGITDPEVVKAGDQWLMFLSHGQEVLLARSEDGLEWKKDKSFVLRGGGVPGALVLSDGKVRVYQSGPEGITSVVFSPDTGMFKPDAGVRLKGPCADPAVWARAGGGYVGVVKRFMGQGKRPL